jgi:beta-galactosidase
MVFPKRLLFITHLIIIFSASIFPQIIFNELPDYQIKTSDSVFFDITSKRDVISLNGPWKVYSADDPESPKVSVNIPSVFEGEGELIFEKKFNLEPEQLSSFKMNLFFLGLNYSADISVNNIIIYRHTGGDFPFHLDLPKDILNAGKENLLSVKLLYKLDSENTIPVKQRFLFPQNFGGIFRDVYIHLIPNISISDVGISYKYDFKTNKLQVDVNSRIENKEFRKPADTLDNENEFELKVLFNGGITSISKNIPGYVFQLKKNTDKIITQQLEISSPILWSPDNPQMYLVEIELWQGENLLDKSKTHLAIFSFNSLKDSLLFNGRKFNLKGVTYIPSFNRHGNLIDYNRMEEDIRLIKNTGFNSVRFSKSLPHPYLLALCTKYGLLAFIDIPINSVPASIAGGDNFHARSKNYLSSLINAYKKYSSFAGLGLGSSYLPGYEEHNNLISSLAEIGQKNSRVLIYASFAKYEIEPIENVDLYGIELIDNPLLNDFEKINELQIKLGLGKVFISDASYPVNINNTNGYVNEYSFEAQAKYFEDLIDYSNQNNVSGYFINSMFDYRGEFASLIYGYNSENLYNIGLVGEDRNTSRLSYKIVESKLQNGEPVTIPIGSKRDDSPMSFIVVGLLLALIMGVLVNSGKKFREDSSRALLRPYNFFADIRDQRMISGLHSTILALVVAMVSALLVSNILFYLKTNLLFEKILLSFGSERLIKVVSYLSWNPLPALLWLSVAFFIILLLIIILVRVASFFVKHRVYISNVYFVIIWSFIPFALLIPVGIILYRLLNADVANLYVYIGLFLFCLWVIYRLLKGIYVIFDVNPGSVYFYSGITIIVALIILLVYFELKNSVIDYLLLTFKQYNILG